MTSDALDPPSPEAGPGPAKELPPLGRNPFVGPRPYQPGERLFGRRKEIRDLYYLLSAQRIVWLHSPSGAGKTSLIWASLAPLLTRDGFAVCPPIRVNLDLSGIAETVPGANPYVLSVLLSLEERLPQPERRPLAELGRLAGTVPAGSESAGTESAGSGLATYLKALAEKHRAAGKAGTVLVLDQFEEVLTVHPLDRPAKVTFFQVLGEALRDPNLWALFALREEYLAPLEPYVDWIPSRWSNTFRLDLLGREPVLEVLDRSAEQGGRRFAPQVAELLFANLARTQVQQPDGSFREDVGTHAEPVQLQVVCRRLWDSMPAEDRSIDPEDLAQFGDVSQALAGYYADSLAHIAAGDQALERRIRAWFGERLIAAGGIRGQVLRGRDESEGLPNPVVEALLDTHLIRAEQRAGATRYELAHDRLVEPVLADNAAWLDARLECFQQQAALWVRRGRPANGGDQLLRGGLLGEALAFQRDHPELVTEDEERLIGISRSARRTRRWTWSLLGLLAALIVGFAGTAWVLMDRAQQKEREAWYQVAKGQRKDAVAASASNDPLGAAQHWALAAWRFDWAKRPAESANALLSLRFINDRPLLRTVIDHGDAVNGAAYSSDGERILTWGDDSTAQLWDAASGAALIPSLKHNGSVSGAQFSRDDSRILTWSMDRTARLWNSATGEPLLDPLNHDGPVLGARFSQDESRILTWTHKGTAGLWDSATGAPLIPPLKHKGPIWGAQFSRDESRILTWSDDRTARLWDSATGKALFPLNHGGPVDGAQFSRDESRILTWGRDRTARLWNSATGAPLIDSLNHDGAVLGAQFSQDESRILTWSHKGTARLWDSATGAPLIPPLKHKGPIWGAQFSRDESRILTWSDDRTARLWDSATGSARVFSVEHGGPVWGARFSGNESRILTWGQDGSARLWDSASGASLMPPLKHDGPVRGAQLNRDESCILTWSRDGSARLWDSANGTAPAPPLGPWGRVVDAQFSRDESRILTRSADGTTQLWDSASGAILIATLEHGVGPVSGRFSRDGSRVLTWGADGTARLWDSATGAALIRPLEHHGPVLGAEFSRDESRIVTWSEDETAQLWDSASGAALARPLKHCGPVWGAQFSRNGSRILTWGADRTARLWDSASGAALVLLGEHDKEVSGAQFSPNESRILTRSFDGTARLWDSASGDALIEPLKHGDPVSGIAFSQDKSRILTWSQDGSARLWDIARSPPKALKLWHEGPVLGARFSRDESRILTWSQDGSARLWDRVNGAALVPPLKHNDRVSGARFSLDESRILTWSQDGSARLWDSASGAPLTPPLPHDQAAGEPRMDPKDSRLGTWTPDGGPRTWDLSVDRAWPIADWPLRIDVETGTFLMPSGVLTALSAADWKRKRYCEYDAIRRKLNRISDAKWAESQRRCKALDEAEKPRPEPAVAAPRTEAMPTE